MVAQTGRYSPLTLKDDELQVRKIEELWGTTLLENLTLKMISDEYDKLFSSKKATKSTLHKLNATLSLVMDEAVANELVDANPCGYVKAPRPKPKERKALSDEQALELAIALRTEEQTGSTVVVWIALATGMRRGEILGLVWRNVDFERKRIYVGQQYAADHKIRDPKSEKSHRWLGLDDGTVMFLAEWKEKQARAMEIAGLDQDEETPVCTNSLYKFMDPNTFNRWRRQYFADHGLGEFGPAVRYTDSSGRKRCARGRTSATTCTSSGTRRQRCSSAPAPTSRRRNRGSGTRRRAWPWTSTRTSSRRTTARQPTRSAESSQKPQSGRKMRSGRVSPMPTRPPSRSA